jgi:O-antigen/teichoic acid export membrane protein
MVLLVILGRTGRTEFNFPATAAALVVNVVLNLILVPSLEIVGAGLALVISYLVVVALMYRYTQRLFPVPYEWGRLAKLIVVSVALVALGELLMPTAGAVGLLGRIVVWLAYPVTLLAAGFFSDEEKRWLGRLRHPVELAAELAAMSRHAPAVEGAIPEAYEVVRIDEDSTA